MMETIIKLENLTKRVGSRTIVKNINLELKKGEVLGFLGPNGAGKTTTMRMMVGLIKPTSGDVLIEGKSIKAHREQSLKKIGAIIENPAFYNYMSGWKNLKYFSNLQGRASKEKLAEIVEVVGLTDRIHDKVRTYSLGMKQRLGLAQCLIHDPDVLILDEPTNGLDPSGIREFREYIRRLARERNLSIMVSSHQISEMELMCDSIAIIKNGELASVQSVHELDSRDEREYMIELDRAADAKEIISSTLGIYSAASSHNQLTIRARKEDIPQINKLLLDHNFNVYFITETHKTLEDRFMEITQNSEGNEYHHA
jgi:ABC-2 type transport system ATP-binding protein